jgi:hypothetical protein
MSSTYPEYPDGYTIPTFLSFALQCLEDEYDARSIDLPARRYWMVGTPAFDCNQAVVHASAVELGAPGQTGEVVTCDAGLSLTFFIHVLRCTPVASRSGAPSPSEIQETSALVAADMEILLDLTKRLQPDRSVLLGGVDALGPEGGLSGANARYVMSPYVYA